MEQIDYPDDYFAEGLYTKTSEIVKSGLSLYCDKQNVQQQEVIDHALREFLERRGVKLPLPAQS